MDFRDFIRVLRKGWVWVLAMAVVGTAASGAYVFLKSPTYTSQSTVFVSTESGDNAQELEQGNTFTEDRVTSYASLVAMPAVLDPVIAKLGLHMDASQLAKQIDASAPVNTTLVTIQAKAPSPTLAANIANATASSLSAVVSKLETTNPDDGVSPVKLSQVQGASVPASPSSPRTRLSLLIGLLAGLAVGVAAAFARDFLDTRVRTEADVEDITDAPIVGGIAFDPDASERPLILLDDPHSIRAEAFRSLRTNLQYLMIGDANQAEHAQPPRKGRSFLITSSRDQEGKSTTTANLALAIASTGSNVLVVDADLRRPRLAEYLGLDGSVGLTDLLLGRATLQDVAQPWAHKQIGGHLYVLASGRIPPNPSELLGSSRMEQLIAELEARFDYVLFDTPPLLPVTDALVLAKFVFGVLTVVSAGRTHRNELRAALGSLEQANRAPLGVVMTMLPTKGPDAYGYGRYGYGYSYGVRGENRGDNQGSSGSGGGRRRATGREGSRRRTPEPV